MINRDRVVNINAIDLLTLYTRIFAIAGVTVDAIDAENPEGEFVVDADPANAVIASEPVKSLDFAAGATAAVVYFAPTYDYEGFKVAGAAVVTTGDEVVNDHANLYKATLSSGAVAIEKVGL